MILNRLFKYSQKNLLCVRRKLLAKRDLKQPSVPAYYRKLAASLNPHCPDTPLLASQYLKYADDYEKEDGVFRLGKTDDMNKRKKILIGLAVASAVGITYVLTALRGLPEAFDWEDDE